jgi:pimeloyl-ACP methyl ester carboxylesterase
VTAGTTLRRYAGLAGGALGVVAAGAGAVVLAERRLVSRRRAELRAGLGSLRGEPRTVVADDGVQLHVELDEPARASRQPGSAGGGHAAKPTLVFVHGYALNLDSWHFQRQALRGRNRLVFYDQRSHGRSARSPRDHCTIDQLGRDLAVVLDQVTGDDPVVLVGHSMGAMTIMALAEQHPQWFGGRVAGVALISTSADSLNAETLGLPGLPGRLLHQFAPALIATLAHAPRLVETGRRAGSEFSFVLTRRLGFGEDVSAEVVDFTDEMLAATPFEVVADFFPGFDVHDKREALPALRALPCVVVCGSLDAITPVDTCRRIAELVSSARFVEVTGAGHMVILERPDEVTAALVDLVARTTVREPDTGTSSTPPLGRRPRRPDR